MRRVAASLACLAVLAACEKGGEGPPVGRAVDSGFGLVAGEDALSSSVARTVLGRGGSAADAAAAYFFMAAVNAPSRVSLASGGACLTYEEGENRARLLDFRNAAGGGVAIPGAVRGISALQAVFGRLSWQDLLVPAERAARFGVPVSRSLAGDLEQAPEAFLEDAAARRIFTRAGGDVLGEGDHLVQFELSDLLSGIRIRGASDFYAGQGAGRLVEAARIAGHAIAPRDLRAYAVAWREPLTFEVERGFLSSVLSVHLPGEGFGAPHSVPDALFMLREGDAGRDAGAGAHLVAEVALRTAVARAMRQAGAAPAGTLMAGFDPGRATATDELRRPPAPLEDTAVSSGVVTADRDGNAVACVFTARGPFGTGRMLPGTGVPLPESGGDGAVLLPLIAVNKTLRSVVFAGTATGGSAAPVVMASVLEDLVGAGLPAVEAIARARVHHPGLPHVVLAEAALGADGVEGLKKRGHVVRTVDELARVMAVHCPSGLRNAPASCVAASDPRVPR